MQIADILAFELDPMAWDGFSPYSCCSIPRALHMLKQSNWIGRLRCLAAIFGTAAVAICATWLATSLKPTPMPPLLQTLPGGATYTSGTQEIFSEQLRTRFPVGSLEADMIHELWLEGFTPTTELRAPKREAVFDTLGKGGFDVCRTIASVSWTADEVGRLTAVSGGYSWDCL